ncbi:MAG TPA: hypothetical protein VGJ37_16810, partial [Pyrinomonadaceae bacterium]
LEKSRLIFRFVLNVLVPSANLPKWNLLQSGFVFSLAKGLKKKVVVVGCDVDRQRKFGQDAMRFVRVPEIRRLDPIELPDQFALGTNCVVLDCEKLGDSRQISAIIQWVSLFVRPPLSNSRTQGKYTGASTGAEKRSALAILDSLKEQIPIGFSETVLHLRLL